MRLPGWIVVVLLLISPMAHAHVGSKDVFEETTAGPYKLFVTVRMPNVIPGVAMVEVRSTGAPVTGISITPLPLTGEASKHPPSSDPLKVSTSDPAFFTGGIWMMASGSWQVRLDINGAGGSQTTSVPVPAVAIASLKMTRGLGITLGLLGLVLVLGMAGIVAAAVREARLQPGVSPNPQRRRRALVAMAASIIVMGLMVWGGAKWWDVEASSFTDNIYHPLQSDAVLDGNRLDLMVKPFASANRFRSRSNDDFILDHGHLMHLYAIRQPGMDAVYHLHPVRTGRGTFSLSLPSMPAGRYMLYGDVVHANGFPETLVTSLDVPAGMTGAEPGPDDSGGRPQAIEAGMLGDTFRLPDGYALVWERPSALTAGAAYALRFKLLGQDGKDAADMQPYMGMAGHAAFVKTDGTVFAHVHPEGSAAMAAVMIANGDGSGAMTGSHDMAGMEGMSMEPVSNVVEFPYGFPTSGRYRIFVQMKHGTTVETGAFDAAIQ